MSVEERVSLGLPNIYSWESWEFRCMRMEDRSTLTTFRVKG